MKVSMESPEVKSGNTGQPRATREIPPLYIFSQAGTCPGVPGGNLRGTSTSSSREQRTRATPFAPDRHLFAPGAGAPTTASFLQEHRPRCERGEHVVRTRGGCSYTGLAPAGAPPSVRTWASTFSHPTRVLLPRLRPCRSTALGANGASTFSHPGRVLLPRFRSCRSTALGANRGKHVVRTRGGYSYRGRFL